MKLLCSSIICLSPFITNGGELPVSGKPLRNILVFIADDLACNEIGCYGGQNVKTPNIDQFAGKGVKFDQMFSSTTMCCPIRASIYTGLYPVHHGVYKNHGSAKPDIKSVAHYFKDLGFRVGLTGKMHIAPLSVYPFEIVDGFEPNCVSKTADYTITGITEFMQRDKEQPFLLFVCSTNPHAPWTVGDASKFNQEKLKLPPHFVDNKETRNAFANYLAEIEMLDKQFGDVLNALKSTDKENKTMVMFCGEQGPQFPGGKWTSWDYGQKSAFLVNSPEGYLKGTSSSAIVQYEDVLPTLISYVGGKIPAVIDGKSFMPVLLGKDKQHREWAYGVHNNFPEGTPYPIRSIRNSRYKLIVNLTPDAAYFEKHLMGPAKGSYWNSWVRDAKTSKTAKYWVERYVHRPEIEFYDILKDPWELNNLSADKAMKPAIEKMKKILFNWIEEQGDAGKSLDVETEQTIKE